MGSTTVADAGGGACGAAAGSFRSRRGLHSDGPTGGMLKGGRRMADDGQLTADG